MRIHERIDNFRPCGTRGRHHGRTYIRARVVVDPTRTGKGTVARARETAAARTLQGVYRGGFEMLRRRTPARQG